ncbi:MAG TPA: lysoplasmalogenase [Candidatus Acutalibacter pullistercoris]|uniref:Lysoplasmalogenase n=1 Tax=Candidatus Acutalibacter pullistercoris TaxID=2838418 RepID=A0A9D2C0L5_9FIRM|nr:lysoplasmalogenase [Candidatus Acutalibacter pullistercoris]
MTLLAYSLVALPLWAAQFALYFFLRSAGRERQSLIAKCAGSFLAVGSAGLALHLAGENPFSQVVFWFFLLCTAADALLEISFVPGMLVFGAAHVCLILWLWGLSSPTWWSLGRWVGVYVLTAVLFRKELPTLGKLTVPFLLYPALLGGSLALALPLPFLAGKALWPVALGCLLFYISDMLVAKNQLSRWPDKWQKPIMALYWGALYLISTGLWRG